jgi:hypothetical protein
MKKLRADKAKQKKAGQAAQECKMTVNANGHAVYRCRNESVHSAYGKKLEEV